MPDPAYLAYIPDIFGFEMAKFGLLDNEGFRLVSSEELCALEKPIVTLAVAELISELRRTGIHSIPKFVDISGARKLIVGIPRKAKGTKYWNIWTILKHQPSYVKTVAEFRSAFSGKIKLSEIQDEELMLLNVAEVLRDAWQETLALLKAEGEEKRFFEVELPVSWIFQARELLGIRIDKEQLETRFAAVRHEKYSAYIDVARALKISPSGLSFRNVSEHLGSTELEKLTDGVDASKIEARIKLASYKSQLAQSLVSLIRSDRDLATLSRMSTPVGRCFPKFDIAGTVTGRILVREPYIQGLRSTYRSVIAADPGHVLAYLDYDQFEPGILASLSSDERMLDMYQHGDLYEALSERLFGSKRQRETAKRLFISFLYGMTEDRIAEVLLSGEQDTTRVSNIARSISEFFSQFERVTTYREEVQKELHSCGRLTSLQGGHRKRSYGGKLRRDEQRWALSQRIQGTASLIFKEALLRVGAELGTEVIILPMHDAILVQLRKGRVRDGKNIIMKLMKEAMIARCPNIVPKVSSEKFAN